MLYQCINCRIVWGEEDENNDDGFLSHGLCIDCLKIKLIPLYRKRQQDEGSFPCFDTANHYCDQHKCAYRHLCLKKEK